MLLLSGARLAFLGAKELQRYRKGNVLTSKVGSFIGIDAQGKEKTPDFEHNAHVLFFVVHHTRIHSDIQFWNHVISSTSQSRPQVGRHVQYWGICDCGAECNPYQPEADFIIIGYLEPVEMRNLAYADEKDEALLYDHHGVLHTHIDLGVDPAAQANLILQSAN